MDARPSLSDLECTCVYQNTETHALAMESTSEDLPPGVFAAVSKPRVNRIRHFFGLKCQSTVHNRTAEVVYAIVTNRIIETTNTTNTDGKVGTTPNAFVVAEGALGFGKKVTKGPTPVTVVPIAPDNCHTFTLDRRSYYLTLCTEKETDMAFHLVHKKIQGYYDYFITSNSLKHHVNHELAEEIMKMIELAIKSGADAPMR